MIEVKKGDYCIASVDRKSRNADDGESEGKMDKKLVLIKVTGSSNSGKEVIGRLEEYPHIKQVTVTPKATDVFINLGRTPRPGKAYGFDLEAIYLGPKEHDVFGELHFFTNPDEKATKQLWSSLDDVAKRLKKHSLSKLVDLPCVYEVTPKHGKYAGMFYHSGDLEKVPHRIQISIGEKTLETASIPNYTYVMMHELGHMVHLHCLKNYPKLNAQWIEMYTQTIGPLSIEADRCKEIGAAVATTEGGLKAYMSEADDEAKAELKLILKWIKEVKSLTAKELDQLIAADTKSAMRAFKASWPQVDIASKDLKPMVSEYACRNVKELFAEAFAFYMCDKKLPDRIIELLEKSLTLVRGELKSA